MKLYFTAGFVGFLFLGLALGNNPFGYAFLLLSAGSLVGAIIWWIAGFRKQDPYDLRQLQKIHKDEERRAIEDELDQMDSSGNAVCLNCATHFDPIFNRCPRCGKSLFQ